MTDADLDALLSDLRGGHHPAGTYDRAASAIAALRSRLEELQAEKRHKATESLMDTGVIIDLQQANAELREQVTAQSAQLADQSAQLVEKQRVIDFADGMVLRREAKVRELSERVTALQAQKAATMEKLQALVDKPYLSINEDEAYMGDGDYPKLTDLAPTSDLQEILEDLDAEQIVSTEKVRAWSGYVYKSGLRPEDLDALDEITGSEPRNLGLNEKVTALEAQIDAARAMLMLFREWQVSRAQIVNLHDILGSDPLLALTEDRARAWTEGYQAGLHDEAAILKQRLVHQTANPYRRES